MALDLQNKLVSPGQIAISVWDQDANRIRVDAEVTAVIGELAVDLDQSEDSVAIGDGTNLVSVTTEGALNVQVKGQEVNFDYNEVLILAGASDIILTKTFTVDKRIKSVLLSGDNLGKYVITLNGNEISILRTTWLNFNLMVPMNDLYASSGDILEVSVTNNNTSVASFNATLFFEKAN